MSETTISGRPPRGRPDLAELSPLVGAALASYGLTAAELQNLRYYNNATYRVAATDGQQDVLRVTSNHYDEAALHAEMTWLVSMQAHPDVHVPRPVAAMDGRLLTSASAPALRSHRGPVRERHLVGCHESDR